MEEDEINNKRKIGGVLRNITIALIVGILIGYGICTIVNKNKIKDYETQIQELQGDSDNDVFGDYETDDYETEDYDIEDDYAIEIDDETEPEEIAEILYYKAVYAYTEFEYGDLEEETQSSEKEIINYDEVMNNIFTENGKKISEQENGLIVIKDGKAYMTYGDETTGEYVMETRFEDVKENGDTITAMVVRKMSKEPLAFLEDEENIETYELRDELVLKKVNNNWLVDKYSYVIK